MPQADIIDVAEAIVAELNAATFSQPLAAERGYLPRGVLMLKRVLALHGHGSFGHDAVVGRELTPGLEADVQRLHYDYGRQLVRRGYVVAAPCLIPFGRRLGDRNVGTQFISRTLFLGGSGTLNIDDFICFQTFYAIGC